MDPSVAKDACGPEASSGANETESESETELEAETMPETESTTDEVNAAVLAVLGLPSGFAGCARENSAAPVERSRAARHRAVRSFTVAVLSGDGSEEEDGEEEAVGSSGVLREKAGSEHRPEVVADPARVAAWSTYW